MPELKLLLYHFFKEFINFNFTEPLELVQHLF